MKMVVSIAVLILSVSITVRCWNRWNESELKILFFDVGQGDATLIRFPGGKTLLIDAGGGTPHWNIGRRVLFPELARLGILHLDYALLTHPDLDHAFGFLGLLEDLSIGTLLFNQYFSKERVRLFERILLKASDKGVSTQAVEQMTYFGIRGAQVKFFPLQGSNRNDHSLVVGIKYAGCSALFMADTEAAGERELLSYLSNPVDLLKVGHHGSKTSSTDNFIRQVSPKVSVISVGGKNRYGHPHPQALQRLASSEILRTDFHGFIEISISKDRGMECLSYEGSCGRWKCFRD